jgi:hypothetical protein
MTYVAATRQLDLANRPGLPADADPVTMAHFFAMLHHRISWNVLGGVINQVLSGDLDRMVINYLLRLSPNRNFAVVNGFSTALNRVLANAALTQAQVDAIEQVEELICWIPCNLFQGLNARADDAAAGMDFLPGDVNADGTLPRNAAGLTNLGLIQQTRERLMHRLMNPGGPGILPLIQNDCATLAQLWGALIPVAPAIPAAPPAPAVPPRTALQQATGFTPAYWAPPGAPPYALPGYRLFMSGGVPLTAAQSLALNATVMARVNTVY